MHEGKTIIVVKQKHVVFLVCTVPPMYGDLIMFDGLYTLFMVICEFLMVYTTYKKGDLILFMVYTPYKNCDLRIFDGLYPL